MKIDQTEIFHRYHFNVISDSEKIIKIVHRHWFDIFQQFVIVFFLLCGIVIGSVLFLAIFKEFLEEEAYSVVMFLGTALGIFLWIYIFLIWIDYYFDIWIITNERIINVEQKGLFTRKVSELKFAKIQDVTTEVKGLLQTILNFGDVHVQTAAEESKFLFRQVPDPYHLKSLIMDLIRQHETKKSEQIKEMIGKMEN